MSNTLRAIVAALFFVLIFASGFWLKYSGMPYNSAILNVHKLISLAAAVLLGIIVFQIGKASGLNTIELIAAVVTGVLFIAAIVSGGLTSIDTMPGILLRVHQITLSLAAVSTAVTLYVLMRGRQ